MAAYKYCLIIAIICLHSTAIYAEDATDSDDYDPKCHIDKKQIAEGDNYVDCTGPEAKASNRTTCCKFEHNTTCCSPGGDDKMIYIGSTIAGATVALATCCFVVFWCEPHKMPCTKKCRSKCPCCSDAEDTDDEEEKLTDLAEVIRKQTKMYTKDSPEYAPPSNMEMPEEFKATPKDSWWGTPQTLQTQII